MSTPYTPGPWRSIDAGRFVQAPRRNPRDQHDIDIARVGNDIEYAGERQANARLIASAPDLFVELMQASAMLHHIMQGGSYNALEYVDHLQKIDETLAKAVQS